MGKISRGDIPFAVQRTPRPPLPTDGIIRLSFKCLDLLSNRKFGIHQCRDGYLQKLIERLKDLSSLTPTEFRTSRSSSLKIHEIDWVKTSEPDGFTSLNEQFRALKAWQFEITRNEHGRVHGFLLEDTFFVVWIDPDHRLYPGMTT